MNRTSQDKIISDMQVQFYPDETYEIAQRPPQGQLGLQQLYNNQFVQQQRQLYGVVPTATATTYSYCLLTDVSQKMAEPVPPAEPPEYAWLRMRVREIEWRRCDWVKTRGI